MTDRLCSAPFAPPHLHLDLCVCLSAGWLCLASCPVRAAVDALPSEADFFGELPVVLSATRLAQPQSEAPAATTVIDRQMIEATGAREIPELLRLVPGVTVGWFRGHEASVTYHGLADEFAHRMQVLVDGRSVYLPSIGGVSWSDLGITVDDIERIEVIRGPNTASYGANAFLGMISITTRHPATDLGTHVTLRGGTKQIRDAVLRHGGGNGAVAYNLTVGYQQDSGFDNRSDDKRIRLVNSRIAWRPGYADEVEMLLGWSGGQRGMGFEDDPLDPPHAKNVDSHFQQLHWTHTLSPRQEISVQAYHTFNNSEEKELTEPIDIGLVPPFQLPLDYDILAERYDLELQHMVSPLRDLRLVWGASVRLDRVKAPTYFGRGDTLENHIQRLFTNIEWRATPRWLFNLGAMFEHDGISGSAFSPRFAAHYHLGRNHTLRASVSRATRAPTLYEERGNWSVELGPITTYIERSSGNLQNERITAREIGYIGELPEYGLRLDVRWFSDRTHNLIRADDFPSDEDPVDGRIDDFRNMDKATIRGAEGQVDWRPDAKTRFVFGYARVEIGGTESDMSKARSAPIDNLHLLAMRELPWRMSGSLAYYHVSEMEYLGSGNHTKLQRRLDLRLAKRFGGRRGAQVALVVQNALEPYEDFLEVNKFDTRAFVQLDLNLE